MTFRDVPSLSKFEQHARQHSKCPITIDAYKRIRELITPVQRPNSNTFNPMVDMSASVDGLKASCEAIEKSTRILWACAVATDNVAPPIWDYIPEYDGAIEYFTQLEDLELMAITKQHQIKWEHPAPAS